MLLAAAVGRQRTRRAWGRRTGAVRSARSVCPCTTSLSPSRLPRSPCRRPADFDSAAQAQSNTCPLTPSLHKLGEGLCTTRG